jgi:prepilin-type N-terminal cleavage/methylation domain-containing protein
MKKNITPITGARWFDLRSGFTLLELIISFAVMSIVIFGVVTLYITSIRANAAQVERFIGYSLAQEGLEGVRNIRDSYFRQSLAWDGSDTSVPLVASPFSNGEFVISRKTSLPVTHPEFQSQDASVVSQAMPWNFIKLPPQHADGDLLYRVSAESVPYYVHIVGSAPVPADATPSIYRRTIQLAFLGADDKPSEVKTDRLLVTSHVTWMDHGTPKSINLTTELTNWKQRPF